MSSEGVLQRLLGRHWRRLVNAGALAVVVGVLVTLALVHPVDAVVRAATPLGKANAEGFAAEGCPSRRVFGLYCPGCGSLRATHFLLRGDAGQSWRHNPAMVIIGVPAMAVLCVRLGRGALGLREAGKVKSARRMKIERIVVWAIPVSLAAWMVVRNIPVKELDWTRPPEVKRSG